MWPDKNITSLQNSGVKKIIGLREKKNRQESGLMLVEGLREVLKAREAGVEFKELYLCRDFLGDSHQKEFFSQAESKGICIYEATPKIFSKFSFGERQEGIIAVCRTPARTLSGLALSKTPLLVVMEGAEKPGNVGAILRTCDCAGVEAVMVCGQAGDLYNPNTIRASLGSIFCVPTVQSDNSAILSFLKNNKIKIVATAPSAEIIYTQADFKGPSAIVLGAEQSGLSDFWLRNSEIQVKIPIFGRSDSLNVSAAAAVMIYEAIRQRKF